MPLSTTARCHLCGRRRMPVPAHPHPTRRAMTMPTNPLINKLPRVDRYEGQHCAVPDCRRETRPMSRYCTIHFRRQERTRSPDGWLPRRSHLRPWRELAVTALDEWGFGEHAAVRAAEDYLQKWIASPGKLPERYAGHLRRLHLSGVTGRQMLLQLLAVYGLRYHGHPGSMHYGDRLFRCALGSRFLRTAPLGNRRPDWYTGKSGDQYRPSGATCEAFGAAIASKLGAMPILLWDEVMAELERRRKEADAVKDALAANPLGIAKGT